MKLRFQFGAALAALLMAGSVCSPASGQTFREIAQTAAQERRAQRQARREQQMLPKPPNGVLRGVPPENPGARNLNNLPPKALERLQDMPPEKQEKFLENNQRFHNLPPDQQALIRQRLQAWNRLTPAQQQDLRQRQRVWEELTPEQQREVRQSLLPRWQQLPPPRRRAILQRLHTLRDLSESDRQAKLNDPAFVQGLNPEDREMLTQLAHLHVGMAPDPPGM
jgi:Protein of unknown function (DUF3106)